MNDDSDKFILIDPSIEFDDNMFFIRYDEDENCAWIEDWRDASHMVTIPIAIRDENEEDIPKLIKALERVLAGNDDGLEDQNCQT